MSPADLPTFHIHPIPLHSAAVNIMEFRQRWYGTSLESMHYGWPVQIAFLFVITLDQLHKVQKVSLALPDVKGLGWLLFSLLLNSGRCNSVDNLLSNWHRVVDDVGAEEHIREIHLFWINLLQWKREIMALLMAKKLAVWRQNTNRTGRVQKQQKKWKFRLSVSDSIFSDESYIGHYFMTAPLPQPEPRYSGRETSSGEGNHPQIAQPSYFRAELLSCQVRSSWVED